MDGAFHAPIIGLYPERVTAEERSLRTLEAELFELWGHLSAATYRFLELVAEFDALHSAAKTRASQSRTTKSALRLPK